MKSCAATIQSSRGSLAAAPGRTALFIDHASTDKATASLGISIDYSKLLARFRGDGRLLRAFFYVPVAEAGSYCPIRPLLDWLAFHGVAVVTRTAPANRLSRLTGSLALDLAIDAFDLLSRIDHILLMSGDGDLQRLVETLQRRGARVTILSTVAGRTVADALRRQCDAFVDLADCDWATPIEQGPARLAPGG